MTNIINNLAPQWFELFTQNTLVWGQQSWLVHTVLANLTSAQNCLTSINDLCTSISDLQSLAELTLEQSEQLQDQIRNLEFKKASFNTYLRNNIQPLEIIARENVAASRILALIPANIFHISLV